MAQSLRSSFSLMLAIRFRLAGAGSVSHMASIAASLEGCTRVMPTPDSSPRMMTEMVLNRPNIAATRNERLANSRFLPLSKCHADTPSTNMAPVQ